VGVTSTEPLHFDVLTLDVEYPHARVVCKV
jgi:hypothetical protein